VLQESVQSSENETVCELANDNVIQESVQSSENETVCELANDDVLQEDFQKILQSLNPYETRAFVELGIRTIRDFVNVDLTRVLDIPQCDDKTYLLLHQKQIDFQHKHSHYVSKIKQSDIDISILALKHREFLVLIQLGIRTLQQFAFADLSEALTLPDYDSSVYQFLCQKQAAVRQHYPYFVTETKLGDVSVEILGLTQRESDVLKMMEIKTISQLNTADLSQIVKLSNYGHFTYQYLCRKQSALRQNYSECILETAQGNANVSILGLNPRESATLKKLGIQNIQQLAHADLSIVFDFHNCGTATYQLLCQKQNFLQQNYSEYIAKTERGIDSSIFCLLLKNEERDALQQIGIITIGELLSAKLDLLKCIDQPEHLIDHLRQLQANLRKEYPSPISKNQHDLWTCEINQEGIFKLPLFSEKLNCGFLSTDFHHSYSATINLSSFGLFPSSWIHQLAMFGIGTLGDILLLTPAQLALCLGFTKPIIIFDYSEKIKTFLLGKLEEFNTTSPETFVRSMLNIYWCSSNKNIRERVEIVVRRLLGHSLSQVGDEFGKTRERIRQICFAICTSIMTTNYIHHYDTGIEIFKDVLKQLGGCGTIKMICSKLIETFGWKNQECTPKFVFVLMNDFFRNDFMKITPSLYALRHFPCINCEKLDKMILDIMNDYRGKWKKSTVSAFILISLAKHEECLTCWNGGLISLSFIQFKLKNDSKLLLKMRETYKFPKQNNRLITENPKSGYKKTENATKQSQLPHQILSPPESRNLSPQQLKNLSDMSKTLQKIPYDVLVHDYWQEKMRAVDILLLPPEIGSKIVNFVNEALRYAYENLR
jgi:hypothetical protein